MIYTLTMNPALDYVVDVENFKLGMTNRTAAEQMVPGGKGLNVSMVLSALGVPNQALGFIAGFTGDEIVRRMQKTGVDCDFIKVENGMSRINVKLRTTDGTEINGMGPELSKENMEQLDEKLEQLQKDDVLVLAGSVPKAAGDSFYAEITKKMTEKGVLVVVDTSGEQLKQVLLHHPFLIKPNRQEISEFFGAELIYNGFELMEYAKKLQKLGARNVLVSLGGDGAMLVTENGDVYVKAAPKGKLINSVGAGDSMVAGFLYGYLYEELQKDGNKDISKSEKATSPITVSDKQVGNANFHRALDYGVAAGSASAFSEWLADKESVERIYSTIRE